MAVHMQLFKEWCCRCEVAYSTAFGCVLFTQLTYCLAARQLLLCAGYRNLSGLWCASWFSDAGVPIFSQETWRQVLWIWLRFLCQAIFMRRRPESGCVSCPCSETHIEEACILIGSKCNTLKMQHLWGMNMIRVDNFLALGAGVLRIPLHSHDVSRPGDRLGNPRHRWVCDDQEEGPGREAGFL